MKSGIIFEGPSLIDGKPIVVIAIEKSSNAKTGDMIQTYLIRSDVDPVTANRTGQDVSICGSCRHRGTPNNNPLGLATGRTCYVNIGMGVIGIYKAYKAGKYPFLSIDEQQALGRDRMVRLGSYGDPAAVHSSVFDGLLSLAAGHTGYTHQVSDMTVDTTRLMVSVDSVSDANYYYYYGMRTFRVIPVKEWGLRGDNALLENEILCPASAEAGKKLQCHECKLCNGTPAKRYDAKSIAIVAHGASKNKFQ